MTEFQAKSGRFQLGGRGLEFLVWGLLVAGLLAGTWISLNVGFFKISWLEMIGSLKSGKPGDAAAVLWELRLPRTLLGILIGASLGLAGAAMQGLLRNPLAEPGIMGVSGGAVLGAVLVFYSGIYSVCYWALPLGGMLGAWVTVVAVFLIAGTVAGAQTLILAGVAINTLAFAATALVLNLSPNPYAALEIVFWQLGSLADRSFLHVALAAPFILAGGTLLFWDSRALDAVSLGEETAMSLGVSMARVRFRIIAGTALAVGAAVSVAGSIGFVGLIVPHLLRPFAGHEPGRLLRLSTLGGAVVLLFADIGVRVFSSAAEIKLGVLTALLGGPFFLMLAFKMGRQGR